MKPLLIVCVWALLATSCFARLWETVEQCDKRYGRPLSARNEGGLHVRTYLKKGVSVRLAFAKGRAVKIYYDRLRQPLSHYDVKLFLYVNSQGLEWQQVDQVAEWKKRNKDSLSSPRAHEELARDLETARWRRVDGRAEAMLDRLTDILFVYDIRHIESEKTRARKEVPNPYGF